ncbi:MAG: hypothetical protein FWB86_06395 [Treponema sp.]|nr:hypothetical protein [Treponema sp.]MCL2251876.1 hypothetical protein [Treponema sp.]
MGLTDKVEMLVPTFCVFLVIKTSSDMKGKKISAVDKVIKEFITEVKRIISKNADIATRIAALEFSTGARWITSSGHILAEKFVWNSPYCSGNIDFGAACNAKILVNFIDSSYHNFYD